MLRRLLPLLALLTTAPAFAQAPEEDEDDEIPTSLNGVGRISIQGGWRVTSNETLYTSWYGRTENQGLARAREVSGGPLVIGSFAYAMSDLVEVGIDLFGTGGKLYLREPDGSERSINLLSYGAMIGLRFQTVLPEVGPYGLVPFVGLFTGPALVSSKRQGEAVQESTTQAWVGTLGATWRLSSRWGLTAEYRLSFLRGPVGAPETENNNRRIGSFSAGGNWLSVGVTYTFPPEPSRPLPDGFL
ncbi:porin family protein [Myxococcus sp. RHSTA-1-4]|uniref:porin family protein n=1 Tax=Myxococcus sp. RHSTA-1-4 TaxID=2874601 RepID=UPI001CC1906A|nr:porin family protein [Myxococcus sp. RHSTA-1-4]MBZ4419915.1 porin family protein [Myxococcus sp. RHSTA-1-4]